MPTSNDILTLWTSKDGGMLASEDVCLALIDELFPSRTAHTPLGRGSDCAELESLPTRLALSTDMFLEDVHFRRSYCTPGEVGAKALTRAVSDLAAAGAAPLGFSLSLMIPDDLPMQALRLLLSGMSEEARRLGMALTGGDLSKAPLLGCSLTVWGEPCRQDVAFLRRGPTRPGDVIFVIGNCGLALTGFLALEREGRNAADRFPESCAAHLLPRARLQEGGTLAALAAESGARVCLMDVSDGLARDLQRLLSPCGADLTVETQIMHAELIEVARNNGLAPADIVLKGGEDYALIGSCTERFFPKILEALPQARLLGKATAEQGLRLNGAPVTVHGFDHFTRTIQASPSQSADAPLDSLEEVTVSTSDVPTDTPLEAVASLQIPKEQTSEPDPKTDIPPLQTEECRVEDSAQSAAMLISGCREAWQSGLMAGFNGNASAYIGEGPLSYVLITRSGAAKSRLTTKDFARISLSDGIRLDGPEPSTESGLHREIYRNCLSRVILHTHPPCLLALSLKLDTDDRLRLPLPEAERYRELLGHVAFFAPGCEELAEAVGRVAKSFPAIWLERHGLITHGQDFTTVLALTEELEQLARVHLVTLGELGQSTIS